MVLILGWYYYSSLLNRVVIKTLIRLTEKVMLAKRNPIFKVRSSPIFESVQAIPTAYHI